MLGYILPTFLLGLSIVFVVVFEHRRLEEGEDFDWRTGFGPFGMEALVLTMVLLWFLPGGILLLGPVMLILSVLSPAGRLAWQEYKRPRIMVSIGFAMMIFFGGFTPTSTPTSPSEWGTPLFTENPNAPLYPAGEQYTWLALPEQLGDTDLEIIQSLTLRLPFQYGPLGSEATAFRLASLLDMEQGRLNQAIELLDQKVTLPGSLDVDEMQLLPIPADPTHHYVSSENSIDEVVNVRLYELRSLSIGIDENGLKVGEVLCVATSNWGGELDVLVIVRPIGHTGLSSDRYAYSLTIDWLSA